MEEKMMLQLIIGYLEYSYDEFYEYLDRVKEVEGTEAELIISDLKKQVAKRNETTKSN